MREKQFLPDQRIITCLIADYGIKVIALTFMPLGGDMDASVYKAQADDQKSYFVKLKRGHYHDNSALIQLILHDAGMQQIISPLMTRHNKPTHHIDDYTLIVYPFIEGKDGFMRDLNNDQWITLGKSLRHLHEFHLPSSIQERINQESYSPKWRQTVRLIYAHIDAGLKETDLIALQLLTFMKERRNIIERLVHRAEQLAQKIQQQSAEFVLCHSDIHAGNVLRANDEKLYIVDWDQPIMAPKERDLMFIGGGVANVWNKSHEEDLFYAGYGKTEINRDILAYYRHERIVEDIAAYGHQLLLMPDGGKEREIMFTQFADMFVPQGVVEIACKTDTDL